MSSVVKTVFGGSDDSAQKSQTKSNEKTQAFIEEQARVARSDILALSPSADINRNIGAQAALDVLGDSIPAQISSLYRAEGQAQRNLLGGLSQFERSILGTPGSITAGLGGQPFAPDLHFTQQTIPQFTTTPEALNLTGANPEQQGVTLDAAGNETLLPGFFRATTTGTVHPIPDSFLNIEYALSDQADLSNPDVASLRDLVNAALNR